MRLSCAMVVAAVLLRAGALCAAEPVADPAPVELFVSLQGNDAWSGRVAESRNDDGPFASIARARQAVRELRKTQALPVRVTLLLPYQP